MKAQINIENENELNVVKKIGIINNKDVSTKEKQINLAINIAANCINFSDDETIFQLTSLKKTF